MFFSIFNGGVGLISSKVIVQVAYMGRWALVAHVIVPRFLLDFCLFLLEVIGVNSLGPPFF